MGKKKSPATGNYGIAPWTLPKGKIDEFVLVTEENRKMAIVLGRVLYVIRDRTTYCGTFEIRPRMERGKYKKQKGAVIDEYSLYSTESPEDYKERFQTVIDNGIRDKILYIKLTDALIKYFKL